jgi:WD40 repeat protein
MKKITLLFASLFLINNAIAQSHNSTQSHQGIVNDISIIRTLGEFENAYYTAGEDGFVIKWTNDGLGEHYQITDVGIKLIAVSPNGNDIAVYESDGGSVNKVSIWDWKTLTRKKQFKYNDSITSLEFSAKGTYLIIGTATVDGAVFIRTQNWTPIDKIKTNTSIVNYITTSDTEKTCVFYSPTGNLSYYNLGTGKLKSKFSIMQGLSQCVLYNKNIIFAGVRDDSIYLVNAFKGDSISKVSANKPII